MRKLSIVSFVLAIVISCWSCSDDDDKRYPSLFTDFLTAETDSKGNVAFVTLDDGSRYAVSRIISTDNKKDTLLRCLANYTIDDGKIDIYNIRNIFSKHVLPADSFKTAAKDPVKVTSVWRGNKFLNIHLGVMTTGKGTHTYGFCIDSVKGNMSYVSLMHQRPEDDAESYTSNVYMSLPLEGFATDSLSFCVHTYEGIYTKTTNTNK